MVLGRSQKRMMMTAPLLMVSASCVPVAGIKIAAGPPAAAASVQAAPVPAPTPEWAKLDPGMPYKILEPKIAAAEPFSGEAKSEEDQLRSLDCLTKAIYYEAASEAEDGQRAVAQVVLNRVRHPAYPNSVCGVVYQGSARSTGCQFTFTCDGSLARRPTAYAWARARRLAAEALAGEVYSPVGNATHYHTTAILPYWANSLTRAAVVGAHVFYRWKGSQGTTAAFTQRYAGLEPGAAEARSLPDEPVPVPVTVASTAEVEGGVRKWRGATPEVRIHRGSAAAPAATVAAAAEAPAEPETFGVQIHRSADVAAAS